MKEGQLTDVVLFADQEAGAASKLLPAVLSVGCSNHSPLPQLPHKWNNYFSAIKAWKPSAEKQHYLKNNFNTNIKLPRGTPSPGSHAKTNNPVQITSPCKEKKIVWCEGSTISGSARRHFLSKFVSERRESVLTYSLTDLEATRSLLTVFSLFISVVL